MTTEPLKRLGAEIPPDVMKRQESAPASVVEEGASLNYWWYCMEQNHPNVPTYTSQPLDLGRIFGTENDRGCPACPGCGREVNAVPCAGPKIPPPQIVDYARRFAGQQIVGGIGR